MCRRDAHSRPTHQQTEKPRKTRSKALSVPRRNRTFQGGVWEISDFSVPGLIVQTWAWLERGHGEKTLEALAEFLWARPCTRIYAGDEDFSEWVGVKEETVGHRQEKVASWSNRLHLAKGREKGAVRGKWMEFDCTAAVRNLISSNGAVKSLPGDVRWKAERITGCALNSRPRGFSEILRPLEILCCTPITVLFPETFPGTQLQGLASQVVFFVSIFRNGEDSHCLIPQLSQPMRW